MNSHAKLTLTRKVPARTRTETALWFRKDFMAMSQTFRDIRSKARNPMDRCWWCKHPFADGEMMALACFEGKGKGNKALCQDCATELLASGE